MKETRPVFRYLLIAAFVIYVIGVCLIQADLYTKVGGLEHAAMHASAQDKAAPTVSPTNGVVVKVQTKCPITGEAINKTKFVDQDGTRIYVCCNGCLDPVKKGFPAIKAKFENEGITLDKTPVKDAK